MFMFQPKIKKISYDIDFTDKAPDKIEDPLFDSSKFIHWGLLSKDVDGELVETQYSNSYNLLASKKSLSAKCFYADISKCPPEFMELLTQKLNDLTSLHHPCIAPTIGYSFTDFHKAPRLMVLTNYLLNQPLQSKIGDSKFFNVTTNRMLTIYGIACGMAYLHSKNIIHTRLNLSSIFYIRNYPVIFDYFHFKAPNMTHASLNFNETLFYVPPEVLQGEDFTKAGDVYSFSMVLYQLLTQRLLSIDSDFYQFIVEIIQGKRPTIESTIPPCYADLIKRCWSSDPQQRPTFDEIVVLLETNEEFKTSLSCPCEEFQKYDEYIKSRLDFRAYLSIVLSHFQGKTPGYLPHMTGGSKYREFSAEGKKLNVNHYTLGEKIGEGSFGLIYKIIHNDTEEQFVCKISKTEIELKPGDESAINLQREIRTWSTSQHPAITQFYGYCPTNFKYLRFPILIMEYLQNGSLADMIALERRSMANPEWTSTKKLINIYGIASALNYLHSKSILHRDIKAENILVNDEFTPKLSDFGLSITLDEIAKATKKSVRGTPTHMAPEIWESSTYTEKTDVYAYGFTVYEIITNEIPFKNYKGIYQVLHDVVDLKKRPEFPESIPQCYKQLIEECWAQDPADRPTFKEILKRLKENAKFINSIAADPDDFLEYAYILDPQSTPVEESTVSSQEVKLDGLKISDKQQEPTIEKDKQQEPPIEKDRQQEPAIEKDKQQEPPIEKDRQQEPAIEQDNPSKSTEPNSEQSTPLHAESNVKRNSGSPKNDPITNDNRQPRHGVETMIDNILGESDHDNPPFRNVESRNPSPENDDNYLTFGGKKMRTTFDVFNIVRQMINGEEIEYDEEESD